MAITWGSWVTGTSGRQMRIGREFVVTAESGTSITVRLDTFFQSTWGVSDSGNSYSVTGGNWSRSGSVSVVASANQQISLWSQSQTFTKQSSSHGRSFSASLNGIDVLGTGTTATMSGTFTVPAEEPGYGIPAPPSDVQVTRNSDTSHTIEWTNNPTSSEPYNALRLERWSSNTETWTLVAIVTPSTSTSFTDTGTEAGNRYRWRIRAGNSAGSSTWANSAFWQTTPLAPGQQVIFNNGAISYSPVATRMPSGDVLIQWQAVELITLTYTIERRENGGSWTSLTSGVTGDNYTHTFPSTTVTHQYRVRAVSDVPAGNTLNSADWLQSGVIPVGVPPSAPTNLSPSGVFRSASADITLTWSHNGGLQTDPQTKFQIRHRAEGGSWTTESEVTSGTSSWTLPADTYADDITIEWEVRTWGIHTDPSPWSSTASFFTASPPTASIIEPDGTDLETSTLYVAWGYDSAGSHAQDRWRVTLVNEDTSQTVEVKSGVGAAASTTMATTLTDATDYKVLVEVRDVNGQWSEPADQQFTTDFLPAEDISIDATWHQESGAITLNLVPYGDVENESVPAVSATVQRRINDGEWVTIAEGVPPDANLVDTTPVTLGTNEYRVIGVSSLPSTSTSDPVSVLPNETFYGYLSGGHGFAMVARVWGDLRSGSQSSTTKALADFAGRTVPVELAGEHTRETVSVTCTLHTTDGATPVDITQIAKTPGLACWRGPDGTRIIGSLSEVVMPEKAAGVWNCSFSVTEAVN